MFSGCEPPRADEPGAGSEAKQGERSSLDALLRRELRHGEGGGRSGGARAGEVTEQGQVNILEAKNVGSFYGNLGWIRTSISPLIALIIASATNRTHNIP